MATETVYCPKCGTKLTITDQVERVMQKVGSVVGTVGGGTVGAGLGIAGAFGAISGLLPLAVLGLVVGSQVGKWMDRLVTCPQCKHQFNR